MNALGREVKKFIIKRKDSDAGEAGRALEEVRASLFNDVRTSEGAKLQQQRFCGPFVALSFNFLIAVGIIMVNKLVLGSRVGFDFPIFLTFIHYACSWFLMTVFNAFSLLPPSPPSKFSSTRAPFSSLFALGAVMSLSNGLANVSLKHNSVGFYQMAKIAVTPTIVLTEFLSFGKRVSANKVYVQSTLTLLNILSFFSAVHHVIHGIDWDSFPQNSIASDIHSICYNGGFCPAYYPGINI
ncbi:hypothetical protein AMTR_s00051p00220420 [Amborella trichopoda]|uniref:Sugar phosphate transporter domain-containing protein n=1 Tax=Amborella trichopoda TaxID=13333 RepID=U5D2P5_AMBTC|nr:hypothetical protein AMTR_s00051p00220420 [Amborella trichopoda]